MCIIKEHGKYLLICDNCGRDFSGFDSFEDAVDYAYKMNWGRRKVSGSWENYCRKCMFDDDSEE